MSQLSVEQLAYMLTFLSPDFCRDEWWRILASGLEPPDVLVQLLEGEITSRMGIYSQAVVKEDELRQEVQNLLNKVS